MALTSRQLNRATLARQLLLRREPLDVVDAVHRVVALQAQEPASPYVALWNRVADFDAIDLDAAFADRTVVKATLMRITLHAVDARDYPAFHDAMLATLRAARLNDRRFTTTGLTIADADALLPDLVEFAAQPRTNIEFTAWLDARLGAAPDAGVWWALRSFAPLVHAPTGSTWAFGARPAYVAAPVPTPRGDGDQSVPWLVRRYLEGFGPASALDVAQFTFLRRSVARDALRSLAGTLTSFEGPDGAELFDVPGAPLPPDDTPAPPRLMAMWDSTLLAYADRSRIVPAEYRQLVVRRNGDVLATVLVDGYVCGVWRPVPEGIEVTAFRPLTDDTWRGLTVEARSLLAHLADREPIVYRRYARWWSTLPSVEVRTLPP